MEPPDRRRASPARSGRDAEGAPAAGAVIEVHVTTPDAASAERLARLLVEERLAACAQVVPGVRSFYRWEGEVAVDDEHLLLVKSTAGLFPAVRDRIRSAHPYDTPEVLAVPVSDVDDEYATWLRESVAASEAAPAPRPDEPR